MSGRSEDGPDDRWDSLRARVLGLGERSVRKSHYPQLRARVEELERFRQLLDHSQDAIVFLEADSGRVSDCNRTAARLIGARCDGGEAVNIRDLVDADAWTALAAALREAAEGAGVPPTGALQTRLRCGDGTARPVELTIGLAGGDDAVVVMRDITERLRAEDAARQLQQAQRMESVGRLAGGVAHDFNNLLAAIRGYGDVVLEELSVSDPIREDVEEIVRAAEKAAELTRQLLVFSRQQAVKLRVLDLNEVVRPMERMLRRVIGEDVQLRTQLEPEALWVEGDAGQLEQVVMNLAVNARDAMPDGGELLIHTGRTDERVLLRVSDTGHGMDEQTRARIFDPFFTTKEKSKGTGLGLATVYGIVGGCRGEIRVESAPGRGTTFSIWLPGTDARAAEELAAPLAAEGARGTETVLVVEDEQMLLNLCTRILRAAGYTVLGARHGGEALLICEQHEGTIDLLLSDVVMPRLSGPALARRLCPLHPGMRVLFMSGHADEAIDQLGVDRGPGLVQKPFSARELLRRVREHLDR